jgi:hypothetical protein
MREGVQQIAASRPGAPCLRSRVARPCRPCLCPIRWRFSKEGPVSRQADSRTKAFACTHSFSLVREYAGQQTMVESGIRCLLVFPDDSIVILILRGRKESRLIENEAWLRRGREEAELIYQSRHDDGHVETSVTYFEYISWERAQPRNYSP